MGTSLTLHNNTRSFQEGIREFKPDPVGKQRTYLGYHKFSCDFLVLLTLSLELLLLLFS